LIKYAPEYESVQETRQKLQTRQKEISALVNKYNHTTGQKRKYHPNTKNNQPPPPWQDDTNQQTNLSTNQGQYNNSQNHSDSQHGYNSEYLYQDPQTGKTMVSYTEADTWPGYEHQEYLLAPSEKVPSNDANVPSSEANSTPIKEKQMTVRKKPPSPVYDGTLTSSMSSTVLSIRNKLNKLKKPHNTASMQMPHIQPQARTAQPSPLKTITKTQPKKVLIQGSGGE